MKIASGRRMNNAIFVKFMLNYWIALLLFFFSMKLSCAIRCAFYPKYRYMLEEPQDWRKTSVFFTFLFSSKLFTLYHLAHLLNVLSTSKLDTPGNNQDIHIHGYYCHVLKCTGNCEGLFIESERKTTRFYSTFKI